MSFVHLTERRIAAFAFWVSLGTFVTGGFPEIKKAYDEKVKCPAKLSDELEKIEDVVSMAAVKMYSCSDNPKDRCGGARDQVSAALLQVKNFNRVNEFHKYKEFEDLENSLNEAKRTLAGSAPFSKPTMDKAAESVGVAFRQVLSSLNQKVEDRCSEERAFCWNILVLTLFVLLPAIYFIVLLRRESKKQ